MTKRRVRDDAVSSEASLLGVRTGPCAVSSRGLPSVCVPICLIRTQPCWIRAPQGPHLDYVFKSPVFTYSRSPR